jgi:DNA-binding XRE family transcriptional regulator
MVEDAVFVKTQTELGKALNATRKSVGRWMKEEGDPGKVQGSG